MWLPNWIRNLRARYVAACERLEADAGREKRRFYELKRERESAELKGQIADLEKRLSPRDPAQR